MFSADLIKKRRKYRKEFPVILKVSGPVAEFLRSRGMESIEVP